MDNLFEKKEHETFSTSGKSYIFAIQKIKRINHLIVYNMTKADIVSEISKSTGIVKTTVLASVESFMNIVKDSLSHGDNVYLRGFGIFVIKKRAQKTARNISKNTTIIIPEHNIPAFKPAKTFLNDVKEAK